MPEWRVYITSYGGSDPVGAVLARTAEEALEKAYLMFRGRCNENEMVTVGRGRVAEVLNAMPRVNCSRCGGDGKIVCSDPECMVCASDHYCERATVCDHTSTSTSFPMPHGPFKDWTVTVTNAD